MFETDSEEEEEEELKREDEEPPRRSAFQVITGLGRRAAGPGRVKGCSHQALSAGLDCMATQATQATAPRSL